MTWNEFVNTMESQGMEYARKSVLDPDNHMEVVQAIADDYLEGAIDAWNLLKE